MSYAVVTENDVELDRDYISHELGLVHANSIYVSTGEIRTYGDWWDNRGGLFAQIDELHKYILGWLGIDQIKIVTSGGEYLLDQRELDSDGVKLIVIPLGFYYENGIKKLILYYLEYFKELGEFDSRIFSDFEPDVNKDLVLPRKYKYEGDYDSLVYVDGKDITDKKALDIESQELCDSEYGVCVQVLQKTGTGENAQAEVKITLTSEYSTPTPITKPEPSPTPSPTPSPSADTRFD